MDNIEIQAQDTNGNWRTIAITMNNPQQITSRMREVSNTYPNYRVRAIDGNGRVIDIL